MALMSVKTARDLILKQATITPIENVALNDALDRILATDLHALRTQPPFAASAMDGYAIHSSDNIKDQTLNVIGESAAGHRFSGSVSSGETVRIFTGAPMPEGADTIIIQENVHRKDSLITIQEPAPNKGHYVRPEGLDFNIDDIGILANNPLSPEQISFAAAMGYPSIPVRKKPKIAILSLGDELRLPGEKCNPDQIISSNGFALFSLVKKYGGDPIDIGIVADTKQATIKAFEDAISHDPDIVISSGGASVGDHDFAQEAYHALNINTAFWKIAMRPGKPLMMGTRENIIFLGLPGNPVSSMVCSHIFLRPLLAKMTGYKEFAPVFSKAHLGTIIPANDIREEYMRGFIQNEPHGCVATPFDKQDSSILSLAAKANCLIHRPALSPEIPLGNLVDIIKL